MSNTMLNSRGCRRGSCAIKITGLNGLAKSFRTGRPPQPSGSDTPSDSHPSGRRIKLSARQRRWPSLLVTNRMADRKMADRKMADRKMADRKMADRKMADRKMADRKMADRKIKTFRTLFLFFCQP